MSILVQHCLLLQVFYNVFLRWQAAKRSNNETILEENQSN